MFFAFLWFVLGWLVAGVVEFLVLYRRKLNPESRGSQIPSIGDTTTAPGSYA